MIIDDPNFIRLSTNPFEDHPPLIVDPDRVKVLQVALELLQPVRRRYRQILKSVSRIEGFELTFGRSGNALELSHPLIPEQRLGAFVPKGADH